MSQTQIKIIHKYEYNAFCEDYKNKNIVTAHVEFEESNTSYMFVRFAKNRDFEIWIRIKQPEEDADFTRITDIVLDLGKKLLGSVDPEKCEISIKETKEESDEFPPEEENECPSCKILLREGRLSSGES